MSPSYEVPDHWVNWYTDLPGNAFMCQVEDDYLEDAFNLIGLPDRVEHYQWCFQMISDRDIGSDSHMNDGTARCSVEENAPILYGYVHARFIVTKMGLSLMMEKYKKKEFGVCPRTLCKEQAVLPMGLSDTAGNGMVKLYCPKCDDIYKPKSIRFHHTDGASFGTTFPHVFFMTYPELRPLRSSKRHHFVPRLYGFKIHPSAFEYQREKAKAKRDGKPYVNKMFI